MKTDTILLSHGSGGRMMDELIREIFLHQFGDDANNGNADSAVLEHAGDLMAFSTDSFVVDPIFFPGGDIGKLAVCGTVNDLSVVGAAPLHLSCSLILEEGLPMKDLERVIHSMANEAKSAGVRIVTGDTKVVNRGKVDKIFINTSGIGKLERKWDHLASGMQIKPDDLLVINGNLGEHGIAVMAAREGLNFSSPILSDCASLNGLIQSILHSSAQVRFMRDATRGGLASVLCEIAGLSNLGLEINEDALPISEEVKGACEIFGFDPLYIANEGKVLVIVAKEDADKLLTTMQRHHLGQNVRIIGTVSTNHPNKVVMNTSIGGRRIIDKLAGEQLPRIC